LGEKEKQEGERERDQMLSHKSVLVDVLGLRLVVAKPIHWILMHSGLLLRRQIRAGHRSTSKVRQPLSYRIVDVGRVGVETAATKPTITRDLGIPFG
jgi:hypothetical protein